MSHRDAGPSTATQPTSSLDDTHETTMWAGWIAFAGIIMVVVGTFEALYGLVALLKDGYFRVPTSRMPVQLSWTTWGWIHLSLGVLIACAGIALTAGRTWAQMVTILFAFVAAVVNLGFLPAYPIWSTMMITLCVLVIWAVMVHGNELRPRRR